MDNKNDIIKELAHINHCILCECNRGFFNVYNRSTYNKIRNLSLTIYTNALRLINNQPSIVKTDGEDITIDNSLKLLRELVKITISMNFIDISEGTIIDVLKKYKVKPEIFTYHYIFYEAEYKRCSLILKGLI